MDRAVFHIPVMYGDHHVTAVRSLLLGLPGVTEVYASAAFQQAIVTYDATAVSLEVIKQALTSEGYGDNGADSTPPTSADPTTRHTVAYSGVGKTVSFGVELPTWGSGALRPCPGFAQRDVTDEHPADKK